MKLIHKLYLLQLLIAGVLIGFFIFTYQNYQHSHRQDIKRYVSDRVKMHKTRLYNSIVDAKHAYDRKKDIFLSIHQQARQLLRQNPGMELETLRTKLKEQFVLQNMTLHLYLVGSDFVIYKTTYKPDLGFDLSVIPETKRLFTQAAKDGKVHLAPNVSIDALDMEYKFYSYCLLKEGTYLELGFVDHSVTNAVTDLISSDETLSVYAIDENKNSYIYDSMSKDSSTPTKQDYFNDITKVPKQEAQNDIILRTAIKKQTITKSDNSTVTSYVPLFQKDLTSIVDAGNYVMQVKVDISRHLATMQRFQTFFTLSVAAVVIMLAMLFIFAWRRFALPLQEISTAMKAHRSITQKNLLNTTDELGTLARSYNDLYENLQTQLVKNKELLEQNKRFIADTVHQVRTPLTNIMMNSEMIAGSLKDGSVQNFIDQINASINILTNSYEDLSYIISYDSIEYAPAMVDISDMLQERVKFFSLIARVNFKSFETHIQPSVGYMINPIELERIIDNNIANAIKYARPKQPIKITLQKNDTAIVMRFASAGAPIKNQGRIFEQNYRENHGKRGLGLGLNMVKKICQKYGIDYALSRKDHYNIFSYTFWI